MDCPLIPSSPASCRGRSGGSPPIRGADNLAPFSQFQNVTFDPPTVLFCANQLSPARRKDTVSNIERSGDFVWNMATYELREAVNVSSGEYPPEVDEFAIAGLHKLPSRIVGAPRVAESPIQFECVHLQTLRLAGNPPVGTVDVIFGRVVAIHIADSALVGGRIDIARLKPLARLGYFEYTCVDKVFSMTPPGGKALAAGLEGSREKLME